MSDRRGSVRRPGRELCWTGARVRPGHDVEVVDFGEGGALLEGTTRLMPGTHVVLLLRSEERSVAVDCHVTRCEVVALDGDSTIKYRGAVRFETPREFTT